MVVGLMQYKGAVFRGVILALAAVLLAACASSGAPVVDLYALYSQNRPATQPVTQGSYQVQKGDTLYSIAFQHGWDFHELAEANGIPSPYVIYPGQVIHFDRRAASSQTASHSASPSPSHSAAPAQSSQPSVEPDTQPASPSQTVNLPKGMLHWQWPAKGKVLSHYGDEGANKGINIGGKKGSPVKAAAAGVVVYRGEEIRGYGNLLIVKHNDTWLSAYAHMQTMQAHEGDEVKAGEQLGTLGSSGSWRVQLYFEIRKNGKPRNPEKLLPKR